MTAVGGRRDDAARDAIEDAAAQYADDAGVRYAHQDHLAATDQLPAVGDLFLSPLCEHGQHGECPVYSVDHRGDPNAQCECSCHGPDGWGQPR